MYIGWCMSRDSVVGIATSYGLDDRGVHCVLSVPDNERCVIVANNSDDECVTSVHVT
jgi:hypothetical protein